MKVSLILPPSIMRYTPLGEKPGEFHFSSAVVEPPLGLGYLAAFLEKNGHETQIIDANVLRIGVDGIVGLLKDFCPDLIGYTLHSYYLRETMALVAEVKKAVPVPVVIGGYYLREFTSGFMEYGCMDFAVMGEGEKTLLELVERHESRGPYGDVDGLIYMENGEFCMNANREPIKDLDTLPYPARHRFPNELYKNFFSNSRAITSIISSRGCPFKCAYCEEIYMNYRRRKAESVVEEMRECSERYGISEFCFVDGTFIVGKEWIVEFCEALLRSGLKVNWNCRTRINSIDESFLDLMARSGCDRVHLGIESGSDRVLELMNKKVDLAKIPEVVRQLRKRGMITCGYFMLGNPGDDSESMKATVDLSINSGLDFALFYRFHPLPESGIFKEYMERTGSDFFKQYYEGKLNFWDISGCEGYSVAELDGMVARAYKRFYMRFAFIVNQLKRIRSISTFMLYLRGFLSILPSARR